MKRTGVMTIEPALERLIVEVVRQRPGQPRRLGPGKHMGDRPRAHPNRGGNLCPWQPKVVTVRDIREPDYGDILLGRARRIGPHAASWAERCFASRDFPEQAFASVQGMIRLADAHDDSRVDAACAEALDLDRLVVGFLRDRLKNAGVLAPDGSEPGETIPRHANIRGGAYYKTDRGETP